MASLFAAAATKSIVEIETLDDIDDDEFEQRETGILWSDHLAIWKS